jgi:hypothetical protein
MNTFTEQDMQDAINEGIFSINNHVPSLPFQVVRFFEKWAAEREKKIRHAAAEIAINPNRTTEEKHRDIMNLKV